MALNPQDLFEASTMETGERN